MGRGVHLGEVATCYGAGRRDCIFDTLSVGQRSDAKKTPPFHLSRSLSSSDRTASPIIGFWGTSIQAGFDQSMALFAAAVT
jgi:hypothetical protein